MIYKKIYRIIRAVLGFCGFGKSHNTYTKLFEDAFEEAIKEWVEETDHEINEK